MSLVVIAKNSTHRIYTLFLNLLFLSANPILFLLHSGRIAVEKMGFGNGEVLARRKIKGTVITRKKTVFDWADLKASVLDHVDELLGQNITIQLVGFDPEIGHKKKLSKPARLEALNSDFDLKVEDSTFGITLDMDEEIGTPRAIIVKNLHRSEFYLKAVILEDVPGSGPVHFVCNSWVYPAKVYKRDRVFFANQSYLPTQTPLGLITYREEELMSLRGSGDEEELKEWDRVYDYAYYNDLGDPDKDPDYARPVLGGSGDYPYPRRGKTCRAPSKTDPKTESRLSLPMGINIYVPRDERISPAKTTEAVAYVLKLVTQLVGSGPGFLDGTPTEFDGFEDVFDLYDGAVKKTEVPLLQKIGNSVPSLLVKEFVRSDGEDLFKFPPPHVIKADKYGWNSDLEFARETLAGTNPLTIRRLLEFPPSSKLNPKVYGNQTSSMTKEHIEKNLNGISLEQAIKMNKLFIVDYQDAIMPLLRRINATSTKVYATRTLLFLNEDGTLKPVAIELSLPHPDGDQHGVISKVYTPAVSGVEGSFWQLAKIYAAVNDSGYHQLVSHWLHTHAIMEPFVIAMHRQLSVLHPIYKLLHPHFKDTMNLNALARHVLISAGGALEKTVFPAKYSMEMSSHMYKIWTFPSQSLLADLIERGIAVEDPKRPYGIRLLIEDYPYAVDGLEIWFAIETWVRDYCSFYYKNDKMILEDAELQAWWREVREVGHADKKDEPWWPKMETLEELVKSCTIIIWVASALHAAVNFGQYPYGGFPLNRPSLSRRFIPEPGSPEYEELKSDPEKSILKTTPDRLQSILGISIIEVISRHTSDEVYLGQREMQEWTSDAEPRAMFSEFGKRLEEIERRITVRNSDSRFKNRAGLVKMPYNLLFPRSEPGLTAKGIPNSISI